MPILEKTIHSFSSEDPRFPAKNLTLNPVKKWQCSSKNDKSSAYVIFKLKSPEKISSIDIGNNNSAILEISVGRTDTPSEFNDVLLPSRSFMTPLESRESSNSSRVRCFVTDDLDEEIRKKKWDLIKVQCSQPFNRHVAYGISFFTLHSVSEKQKEKHDELDMNRLVKKSPSPKKTTTSFGKFNIFRSGSESSDDNISSFQKWKNLRHPNQASQSSNVSLKEKIESMRKAEKRRQSFKDDDENDSSKQQLNRNRNSLLYDMEDELPNEMLEKKLKLDKSCSTTSVNTAFSKKTNRTDETTKKFDFLLDNNQLESNSLNSNSKSKSSDYRSNKNTPNKCSSSSRHSRHNDSNSTKSSSSKSSNHNRDTNKKTPSKHDRSSSTSKESVTYQPFKKLFSGVVFVISGIQNPDRHELRKKALDLGGKYKSDWDSTCTHLICAFKNTPKYVQVLGKGKIVSKHWIEKCYKEKKRLSWRKFAVDESEREKDDSDEEICDVSLKLSSPKLNKSKETKREAKPEINRNRIQYSSDENDIVISHKHPIIDIDETSDNDMASVVSKKKTTEPVGMTTHPPIDIVNTKPIENHQTKSFDTDDELNNLLPAFQAKKSNPDVTVLECTTDEELFNFDDKNKLNENSVDDTHVLDDEKTILNNKLIFLNGDLSEIDKIKLKKNIIYLKGIVTENKEDADIIIAMEKANVTGSYTGVLVKPLWIFECNEMECLIPINRYKL